MTILELLMVVAAVGLLLGDRQRLKLGNLFRAAMLFMLAGSVYRFDTYLVAFRPGSHWSYFPSVAEIAVTVGLVSGEILAFIVAVKLFPILTLEKRHAAYHH
jgi:Ni/Fe-hydrogenase subunit HybB-like protein